MLGRAMLSPKAMRFLFGFAVFFFTVALLHAEPEGVVSSVRREGVMVTSLDQPDRFIFQTGIKEEHFDGTRDALEAQGGLTVAEPIVGLHFMRPRLVVNGSGWSEEETKLIAAQFHGGQTSNFYLFKTFDGQLFYLPKDGATPVVRVDYILRGDRTLTVWLRK